MALDLGDAQVTKITGKVSSGRPVSLTVMRGEKILFDNLSMLVQHIHQFTNRRDGTHFTGVLEEVSRTKVAQVVPNQKHTLPYYCEVFTNPNTGRHEIRIDTSPFVNPRQW